MTFLQGPWQGRAALSPWRLQPGKADQAASLAMRESRPYNNEVSQPVQLRKLNGRESMMGDLRGERVKQKQVVDQVQS